MKKSIITAIIIALNVAMWVILNSFYFAPHISVASVVILFVIWSGIMNDQPSILDNNRK